MRASGSRPNGHAGKSSKDLGCHGLNTGTDVIQHSGGNAERVAGECSKHCVGVLYLNPI